MSKKKHKRNKSKNKNFISVPVDSFKKETFKSKPCHPVTEIIPNLFLGGYSQVKEMIMEKNVDVLVPLDKLDGNIWDLGFRGEILYFPIQDFGILPSEVYEIVCNKILNYIKTNRKVGLFCMEGHGRTGYVAAGVLGLYGIKDPICLLWTKYCGKAIETTSQLKEIANISNENELYDKYKQNFIESSFLGGYYGYNNLGYGYGSLYDYDWGNKHLFKNSSIVRDYLFKENLDNNKEEKDNSNELGDLEDKLIKEEGIREEDDTQAYQEWWKECAKSLINIHDIHSQEKARGFFNFDDKSDSLYE